MSKLKMLFANPTKTETVIDGETTESSNMLKAGFTLIELMVVVVIIGILAALAIPKFLGATDKSKLSEYKTHVKAIGIQSLVHKVEFDTLPTSVTVLDWYKENGSSNTTNYFSYSIESDGMIKATLTADLNEYGTVGEFYEYDVSGKGTFGALNEDL